HKQAIDFVEDIAKNNIEITEDVILKIHGLILKNIDNRNAGNYRFVNVRISGSSHLPPNHIKLNTLMSEFVDWYTSNKDTMHPVQLAAELHHKLVYIHPFVDGNGRTARLLMNLVLLKHGYPLAIISVKNRADYIKALEKASIEHDLTDFITIVANASEETADKIIELID
ncbi:MAG: Fic family protein, partial [Lachnospiraceae bacterium]|nr:Fic family protein [Lachnospiraceae bacterium]